jgi:NitT/TauT family transport system substrate-binding protein
MRVSRARALGVLPVLAAAAAAPLRAATAPIRVGAEASEPFMEAFYGQDAGLFAQRGLSVETQPLSNGGAVLQAVLGNALDVGNTDLIQLANAYNRGVELAVIASGGMHATEAVTIALCVPRASPIRTAKDLEGRTIGVPNLQTTSQMGVVEWLRRGGADPSTVKFYEMHFSEMTPALLRGTVAAALNGEPFITESKADVRVLTVPADVIAPHYYTGVWYTRRDFAKQDPRLVQNFVDGLYDVARWANAHRPDTALILAKYSKLEIDRIRSMARIRYATSWDPRFAQPLLDFAFTYKLLEKPVAASDLYWKAVA